MKQPEASVALEGWNDLLTRTYSLHPSTVELWGGVECTCNRVGNCYIDQLQLSGHPLRPTDIELFAELGIRRLRTGLLWERHHLDPDWKCTGQLLQWMRGAGIRPIAGLLHHGSGPRHTSLLDPDFPLELAAYARTVATRCPWIDAYTPVNEPHTTARFSGLYGIWYPHQRSRRSYLQALLNETKATVLAMREIRRVNQDAQFIQTEDVGKVYSTETLREIAETLDTRRWLSMDLLCGRVDRHHPLFDYVQQEGFSDEEIFWFKDHPCPPDLVGINYYLTSDRFLDHRVELYPENRRSAEGPFVDVEAVRVEWPGIAGFGGLLEEAWKRYHIPVAITEVHLGGAVEDQIRWLKEAWQGVIYAQRKGASCTAITLWALLGSFYWNELVTRRNGHYEPGVFDIRSGEPVATELARVAKQLGRGQEPWHPAVLNPGWWRNPDRFLFRAEVDEFTAEIDQERCAV